MNPDKSMELLRRRQLLEHHLAAKARRDPAFRERLFSDPKKAIEAELGVEFPPSVTVTVHPEQPGKLELVLPVTVLTSEELSGEVLATVIGGAGGYLDALSSLTTVDVVRRRK